MLSHADNTEDPAPQSQPQAAPPSALRAERLSADEARAVIDLWQAEQVEQTGLTDRPAVPDVAEGLDLSVEDVQRLLAEVRTRREAESRLLAHEQELAEIRLAEQERRLAEERRNLAEIQRQRAELGRSQPFLAQYPAERECGLVPVSKEPLLTRQQRKAQAKESQKKASRRTATFVFLLLVGFWWLLDAIAHSLPLRTMYAPY